MSKTITIKGWVHTRMNEWTGAREFTFTAFEDWSMSGYAMVGPHSFEYTLPESFNPTQAELASLEKQKAKLVEEFTKRLAQFNGRIANLQALSYEGEAS